MGLTAEQLAMRKTLIGASDVPMVLGISPFGGPIDVFLDKCGLSEPSPPTTAQEIGNFLEEGIAQLFAKRTGFRLSPATTMRHPDFPWVGATPDRWVNGTEAICQIKVVGHFMTWHWGPVTPDDDSASGVPEYVKAQCQWEMFVSGTPICHIVALLNGTELRIFQLRRDDELIALMFDAVTEFWFSHIESRKPPPVDGSESSRELMARLYPRHVDTTMQADAEAEHWAQRLLMAKATAGEAKAEQLLCENKLKAIIGEAAAMRGDGWRLTYRTNANGSRVFLFKSDDEGKRAA